MTNDLEIRDRLKSLEHEVRALRDWAARLFTRFPTIPGGGDTGDCQITIGCGLTITDELELRIAAAVLVGAGLISDPEDPNCPLDVNPGDGIEIGPEHNTVQTKIARGLNFVTVGGATRAVEPLLGECLEFNASTGAIDLSDGCGADDCNMELGPGIGLVGDTLFVKLAVQRGLWANASDELELRSIHLAPVASATVIDIGDFLYLDKGGGGDGTAKPASVKPDAGTEAGNQEEFHDFFLGIALEASANGETDDIRVATRGIFTYACPNGTWELGDLVGVDEQASGTALEDQKVASVAGEALAVGRVVKTEASATTTVTIEIVSTILYGGVQPMA